MNTEAICEAVKAIERAELVRVAKTIQIPFSTLEAIKRGRTTDPRGKTCDKIREYLTNKEEA